MDRDEIRDALPDWVGGRLEPELADVVAKTVEADADLAAEARLLGLLSEARMPVPVGLAEEVSAAVLRERRTRARGDRSGAWRGIGLRWNVPTWAVASAALLALALGTLSVMDRAGSDGTGSDALALVLESGYTPWVADDGTVAGAPTMDGLTEEALASLLEEMGG